MSSNGELTLEWWGSGSVPAPASIVWCNFPEHLSPGVPGPKPRPALILKVRYATQPPDGRFYVQTVYGTSKLKIGRRPNDFTISNFATLNVLRLPQATRFDLDNVLWLPWARPYFNGRKPDDRYSTPTMSVLPAALQQSLRWTMARREQLGLEAADKGAASEPEKPKAPGKK